MGIRVSLTEEEERKIRKELGLVQSSNASNSVDDNVNGDGTNSPTA